MNQSNPSELPKAVRDSLGRILRFAHNEETAKEDPDKVLAMLLYQIEEQLKLDPGVSIGYIIGEYCSAFGMSIYSHRLEEKKVA